MDTYYSATSRFSARSIDHVVLSKTIQVPSRALRRVIRPTGPDLGLWARMATPRFPRHDHSERTTERLHLSLPARLTWKDSSGAVRFASVTTRDISEAGAFVVADNGASIPLFRIVHLQLERGTREVGAIPERLREGRVMSAVWRVAPTRTSRGTPGGYALRFLVEPRHAETSISDDAGIAAAS